MTRRLVALTTSYPLRPSSCAGVFVRNLYQNLPSDWTVEVVCPDDDGSIQNVCVDNPPIRHARYAPRSWQRLAQQSGGLVSGMRQAPLRIVLIPALLIALTWQCARYAKRADLIHANWALCGAIAVAVGRLIGVPVVTTLRGDDVTRASRSVLERLILSIAVRGSRRIVCVSAAMTEQVKMRYEKFAAKVCTCLNGVDDVFFHVSRKENSSGNIRVLSIGSLIPRKGYDILIDAIALMRHRDRICVKIAGDGPYRSALLERAVQRQVVDRVDLVGEVPPAYVPELMSNADVFVLASRSEGRPNVVIEALASGLPVISSRLPGVNGLVVEDLNGWLVDIGDSAELAAALDQSVEDEDERLRRGSAAREGMKKSGQTWLATGARYSEIFSQALLDVNEENG